MSVTISIRWCTILKRKEILRKNKIKQNTWLVPDSLDSPKCSYWTIVFKDAGLLISSRKTLEKQWNQLLRHATNWLNKHILKYKFLSFSQSFSGAKKNIDTEVTIHYVWVQATSYNSKIYCNIYTVGWKYGEQHILQYRVLVLRSERKKTVSLYCVAFTQNRIRNMSQVLKTVFQRTHVTDFGYRSTSTSLF